MLFKCNHDAVVLGRSDMHVVTFTCADCGKVLDNYKPNAYNESININL